MRLSGERFKNKAQANLEDSKPMNIAVSFEEVSFKEILRQRAKTVGKLGVLSNSLPILANLTQLLNQIDGTKQS